MKHATASRDVIRSKQVSLEPLDGQRSRNVETCGCGIGRSPLPVGLPAEGRCIHEIADYRRDGRTRQIGRCRASAQRAGARATSRTCQRFCHRPRRLTCCRRTIVRVQTRLIVCIIPSTESIFSESLRRGKRKSGEMRTNGMRRTCPGCSTRSGRRFGAGMTASRPRVPVWDGAGRPGPGLSGGSPFDARIEPCLGFCD